MGVPPEDVTPDSSLEELGNDYGADSLDLMETLMELEEEFAINIPDEEAEKIQTVGDVIRYLEQRRRPDLEG